MKSACLSLYSAIIVLLCVAALILIFYVNYTKEEKKEAFFTQSISSLDIAYRASMEKYKLFTLDVFNQHIKKDHITELLYKGLVSKNIEQNIQRGLLYKELYPLYQDLTSKDIRQFHFHLKNGDSFLRFHKPNKSGDNLFASRKSVKFANTNNIHVEGFETGRVVSGFRNVFPIKHKDQHIGSVEISVAVKAVIDTLNKLDKSREYTIIVNKPQINSKIFKGQKYLYSESTINPNYLIEDANQYLKDSPKPLSSTAKKINKKLQLDEKVQKAMQKGLTYGTFIKVDDIDYEVSFLPMKGVDKTIEGYLISYHKVAYMPAIIKFFMFFPVFITILTAIFIKLILLVKEKNDDLRYQKQWFNSITETLAEGLYVMNTKGVIEYVNPMACSILGYKKEEMIGRHAHNLFHSHFINDHIPLEDCPIFKGAVKDKVFYSAQEFFTSKDGQIIPIDISSKSIDKNNKRTQIVTTFRDISEKKKAEKKTLLLTKALEASANAIVITDKDAIVEWANPAFTVLTGYPVKDVIGKNPKEFIRSGKHPKEFYKNLWDTILAKKPYQNTLINKRKDGSFYTEELSITAVLDENDEIQNFIAIKQDVSKRVQREEDIKYFAFYDSLTGLPNRRLLIEHLEQITNTLERTQKSVALLFLDLDKFKSLNDTHGHDAGDELLIEVSKRIKKSIRKQDIVARIGGDEFIIVLDNLPAEIEKAKELTKVISEKILTTTKRPFELTNISYKTSSSIGICIFCDPSLKITHLLKRADLALYEVKSRGGDGIYFYEDLPNEDKTF